MQSLPCIAYIGLGANLGDSPATIKAALDALAKLPFTTVDATSRLYSSAPVEAQGDDYTNAVAQLSTCLSPNALLVALQAVEQQFGRLRSFQNAPRTLDLDLLLFEQQIINTAHLQVPHPRMHQRAFVIFPLLEIAPDINLPGIGSAQSLVINLQLQSIQPFAD